MQSICISNIFIIMMEIISVNDPLDPRIVKHASYADCLIQTSSGTIECSKILLAARSQFFHRIFTQKHNEGKFVNLVFIDSSYEAVQCAVDAILGGKVTVKGKNNRRVKYLLRKWEVNFNSDDDVSKVSDAEKSEECRIPESSLIGANIEKENEKKRTRPDSESSADGKACQEVDKESDTNIDSDPVEPSDDDSTMDWTKTTSGVDVATFQHIVIKGKNNKHKYLCNICKESCTMYDQARKHFYMKHKDYSAAKNILIDAEFERKLIDTSLVEIRKLLASKKETERNLLSELNELSNKGSETMEKINAVSMQDLEGAPTLERKKKTTLESFAELKKVISSIKQNYLSD